MVRERAESGEEPARSVRRAIEIGTRVLDREETAIEVDYVRREFERLTRVQNETIEERNREAVERIEDGLRRALGGEEGPGALGRALESHSEELSERIATTFGEDREGAVQAQIKRMLEQRDEEFLSRLSAEDAQNPLAPILAGLRNWAKERREDQDSRDRKLEEKLDELLNRASELAGLEQWPRGPRRGRGGGDAQGQELRGPRRSRARADRRHPGRRLIAHGRRGRRRRRQEGRHPDRAGGGQRSRLRSNRLRGQGQAALQERRLARAERGDGRRAPPPSPCWWWPARIAYPPGGRRLPSTRATS